MKSYGYSPAAWARKLKALNRRDFVIQLIPKTRRSVAMKVVRLVFAFAMVLSVWTLAEAADNLVLQELLKDGIKLTNGEVGKLPPPALADGLTVEQQKQAIEKVVKKDTLARNFMTGGKTDAWQYKQTDIRSKENKPKASVGRLIDLYFVAEGSFSSIADPQFMKQQVNQGNNNNNANKGKAEFYAQKELDDRGLKIVDEPKLKDRYAHILFPLFNMVEIGGTGYGVETIDKESVLVAFRLDPKFADDKTYPNQWRSINRGAAGNIQKGAPNPYEGAGGYAKVTELKGQTTPRVFIEYHLLFDEPYGWFNGAPTLNSKLPTKYDEDVRQFRVDLKEFEKKNPPKNNAAPAANPQAAVRPAG